jgi:hypothetical protein
VAVPQCRHEGRVLQPEARLVSLPADCHVTIPAITIRIHPAHRVRLLLPHSLLFLVDCLESSRALRESALLCLACSSLLDSGTLLVAHLRKLHLAVRSGSCWC